MPCILPAEFIYDCRECLLGAIFTYNRVWLVRVEAYDVLEVAPVVYSNSGQLIAFLESFLTIAVANKESTYPPSPPPAPTQPVLDLQPVLDRNQRHQNREKRSREPPDDTRKPLSRPRKGKGAGGGREPQAGAATLLIRHRHRVGSVGGVGSVGSSDMEKVSADDNDSKELNVLWFSLTDGNCVCGNVSKASCRR